MRRLILIRHSLPEIELTRPASTWKLSDDGRRRCQPLAKELATYVPATVVSSTEPKAAETGALAAGYLEIPFETAGGLHEHERPDPPQSWDRAQFELDVARFFAEPNRLVLGAETADQAHARFEAALEAVLAGHPHGNLAVVTHGTVLSLFVSRVSGQPPFPLWQGLGMPAYVVLDMPDYRLVKVVNELAADRPASRA